MTPLPFPTLVPLSQPPPKQHSKRGGHWHRPCSSAAKTARGLATREYRPGAHRAPSVRLVVPNDVAGHHPGEREGRQGVLPKPVIFGLRAPQPSQSCCREMMSEAGRSILGRSFSVLSQPISHKPNSLSKKIIVVSWWRCSLCRYVRLDWELTVHQYW